MKLSPSALVLAAGHAPRDFAYSWPIMIAIVIFVGILGSVEKGQAKAGCDCKQWQTASSCAPRSNDHSRCWGVCCRGEKGQRRISAARKAPQFLSRGHLVGPGCCRTMGGGVRAWGEPSTAEAIAAKRVLHDLPMNRSTCAAHCAALKGCTHFELNMYDQPARSNQGVCSVFATGGFSVTTACKGGSKRPRRQCFAAVGHDHRLWHYSPPRSLSDLALKYRRSVAVCVVGQLRSAAQTAPTIRRHVLNVLDADAFMVSQLDNINRLNQSLAIERLLGPRVRSAVHGTAQDFHPARLLNQLEQVAQSRCFSCTPKLVVVATIVVHPLSSTQPLTAPPPLATRTGSRRTARALLC